MALSLLLGSFAPAAWAQEAVSVRGRLTVTHAENFETGRHDVLYRIEQAEAPLPGQTQRSFRVDLDASQVPDGAAGALVEVHGTATVDGALSARSSAGGQLTVIGQRAATPPTEDQRTIVMLIRFQDPEAGPQATPAAVAGIMFDDPDSIDALYRETTGNKIGWSGDVVGPYTVPFDSSSSDYYAWALDAEAQAQAQGVDLSLYTRRLFVTPPNGTGYGGVANGGGSNTRAWVFRWDRPHIYAHELGHNLGLGHASTPSHSYGDQSDFMGNAPGLRHCNAPHKIFKGWLAPSQVLTVGSGIYTVSALALPGGGVRALRIPVSGGPDVYVSFRNDVRFDGGLQPIYVRRTSVHTWGGGSGTTLHLTLPDGHSYSENGVTVTQLSNDGVSATVAVSLDAIPNPPTLAIAPPQGAAPAGAIKTYAVTLTNQDTGVSPPTTFDLSVAGQATDWTYSVTPSSLTLAAGASQTVQVQVKPLPGIPDTSVGVTVYVTGAWPVHTVDASLIHHVDSTPPTAPSGLLASPAAGQVKLTWTLSQDAHADLGLVYRIWRDGVQIGSAHGVGLRGPSGATQGTYTDYGVSNGTFDYEVSCVDAAGNESGRSNLVTVRVGGGVVRAASGSD